VKPYLVLLVLIVNVICIYWCHSTLIMNGEINCFDQKLFIDLL